MPGEKFYRNANWLALRLLVLRRDAWRCTVCGAVVRSRANVDHILSRRERPDLALDPNNLRTLCQSCHSAKTNRYDGGRGNTKRKETAGYDNDGNPLDSDHPWNVQ